MFLNNILVMCVYRCACNMHTFKPSKATLNNLTKIFSQVHKHTHLRGSVVMCSIFVTVNKWKLSKCPSPVYRGLIK